jgi:hypothetical protein
MYVIVTEIKAFWFPKWEYIQKVILLGCKEVMEIASY